MTFPRILWGAAWAAAALASVVAWSDAIPAGPRPAPAPRTASDAPAPVDTARLATAARVIRDRNPFRLERQPTDTAFDPWAPVEPVGTVAAPPAPPRPHLTLVGILGGPPWHALLRGIPGREAGVILRLGEEAGGIRLEKLHADTARLAGLDTTWVLTLRQAWR